LKFFNFLTNVILIIIILVLLFYSFPQYFPNTLVEKYENVTNDNRSMYTKYIQPEVKEKQIEYCRGILNETIHS